MAATGADTAVLEESFTLPLLPESELLELVCASTNVGNIPRTKTSTIKIIFRIIILIQRFKVDHSA